MPCLRSGALAAAAFAVLLTLSACAGGADANKTGASKDRYVSGDGSSASYQPDKRKPAPEVSGETLEGEQVSLADHRGEVVVLNFWASWCGPCRSESPVLNEVYNEHRENGVRFLGVNIKDDRTAAKAFARKEKLEYPSLYDQPGKVSQAFRDTVPPNAIPSTLVIDREGRIAGKVIGETNYNQLSNLVKPVVEKGGGGDGDSGS